MRSLVLLGLGLAVAVLALPRLHEDVHTLADSEEGAKHAVLIDDDTQMNDKEADKLFDGEADLDEASPKNKIFLQLFEAAKHMNKKGKSKDLGESSSPLRIGGFGDYSRRMQEAEEKRRAQAEAQMQQNIENAQKMMAAPQDSPEALGTDMASLGPNAPNWACKYCAHTCMQYAQGNIKCRRYCGDLACKLLEKCNCPIHGYHFHDTAPDLSLVPPPKMNEMDGGAGGVAPPKRKNL